ncbi:ABC transporter substrate-binding protein, partial [Priestia megaterium]|uniref:ABC transporter substrate-binding protein n=1 Tax=Priestia megaterium TaxID=1404 RepID=UPI0019108B31
MAIPAWAATKAESFPRAMALHGFDGALRSAGRSLEDVRQVEVSGRVGRGSWTTSAWPGIDELERGEVDAVYVKGGRSLEDASRIGAVAAVRLDDLAPEFRVNNGTPRPITVHASLLDEHPELVDAFLRRTLDAADWAREHPLEARELIGRETGAGDDGIRRAYGDTLHVS